MTTGTEKKGILSTGDFFNAIGKNANVAYNVGQNALVNLLQTEKKKKEEEIKKNLEDIKKHEENYSTFKNTIATRQEIKKETKDIKNVASVVNPILEDKDNDLKAFSDNLRKQGYSEEEIGAFSSKVKNAGKKILDSTVQEKTQKIDLLGQSTGVKPIEVEKAKQDIGFATGALKRKEMTTDQANRARSSELATNPFSQLMIGGGITSGRIVTKDLPNAIKALGDIAHRNALLDLQKKAIWNKDKERIANKIKEFDENLKIKKQERSKDSIVEQYVTKKLGKDAVDYAKESGAGRVGSMVTEMVPYLFSGGAAGAKAGVNTAIKGAKALSKLPSFLKNTLAKVGEEVAESAVPDLVMSTIATGGKVGSGEIEEKDALKDFGKQALVNQAGNVVGGAVVRNVTDLVGDIGAKAFQKKATGNIAEEAIEEAVPQKLVPIGKEEYLGVLKRKDEIVTEKQALKREIEGARAEGDFEKAGALKDKEKLLLEEEKLAKQKIIDFEKPKINEQIKQEEGALQQLPQETSIQPLETTLKNTLEENPLPVSKVIETPTQKIEGIEQSTKQIELNKPFLEPQTKLNTIDNTIDNTINKQILEPKTNLNTIDNTIDNTINKQRKFSESLKNSENITPEVKQKLEETDYSYTPKSNKESLFNAKKRIEEKGIDNARADFYKKEIKDLSDDDIFEGVEIGKQLQKEGKIDEAVEIFDKLIKTGTERGREVQAFRSLSIVENMSPESALYTAQKQISNFVEKRGNLKLKKEKMTTIETELITKINAVGRKKRKQIIDELTDHCGF